MGWGARRWLKMVPEAVYGVPQTEGAVGTATGPIYIRLHQDNAYTMVKTPFRKELRSADSRNRRIVNIGSDVPPRFGLAGSLNCYAYADKGVANDLFMKTMLDWALLLTSDDLPSFTMTEFDSVRVRQAVGVKVGKFQLTGGAEQDEGALKLSLDLAGQKFTDLDPTFAEPATAGNTTVVFPTAIYNFRESAGGLNLGGVRTKYKSFDLTVQNNLLRAYDETAFPSIISYGGRTIDWTFACQFTSKTDRDNFESQLALAGSCVFTKVAPAHALTLTFNAANYTSGLDRDLPIGGLAYETIHLANFVDTAVPGDLAYSIT